MRRITLAQLLDTLDPSLHTAVSELALQSRADYLVVFENVQLTSPERGNVTIVPVGPGCARGSLDTVRGTSIGDTPATRKTAMYYVDLRAEDAGCALAA